MEILLQQFRLEKSHLPALPSAEEKVVYGLDLFSGIGGITKALEGYVTPVAYCENDRYAQAVLLSRMASRDIPIAPIWDDVKTLTRMHITPPVDIIYGGFPCQDISVAGRGVGLGGERSGLFFEIVRLCRELRPRFIFLENTAAITVRGSERVVRELCRLRYDCRWGILSAKDVGAPHERRRWWLLAHAASARLEGLEQQIGSREPTHSLSSNLVCPSIQEADISFASREIDGVRIPVDRVRALGNAVVPVQAREAFERLMGIKSFGIREMKAVRE